MSRYSAKSENQTIVYGWDHTGVYYYEIYEGDSDLPVEESNFMRGCSQGTMLDKLSAFDTVPKAHKDAIACDLPF